MASAASSDANAAAEGFLQDGVDFTHPASDVVNDEEYIFIPRSPELGMAREGDCGISDADLSLEEEENDDDDHGAQSQLHDKPREFFESSDHDVTSSPNFGDAKTNDSPARRTQRSPPENAQRPSSEVVDDQSMTPALTCAPTRRSARAKSTLVYDQKYHPLDDIIRPSQAAKRRSLHGEKPLKHSHLDGSPSEDSDSDMGSMVDGEKSDSEEPRPFARGRKRQRSRSRTPEPTRRSRRRRTKPKVSYNMKIHPQDSDLRRAGACDGSKSSPSPIKRTEPRRRVPAKEPQSMENSEDACHTVLADDSSEPPPSPRPALEPFAKRSKQLIYECPDLQPDIAYLTSNQSQSAWPYVKGLPFHIFTERIEDQLNKEAEAASPFRYDDHDKENDVTNPELVPIRDTLDGISITPISQYRQVLGLYTPSSHSSIANNAFYTQPRFEALPYGLGWSDGAHDIHTNSARDCPMLDYMSILASGENLPRTPTPADTIPDRQKPAVGPSPNKKLEGPELLR